jgi:hypothetical protein
VIKSRKDNLIISDDIAFLLYPFLILCLIFVLVYAPFAFSESIVIDRMHIYSDIIIIPHIYDFYFNSVNVTSEKKGCICFNYSYLQGSDFSLATMFRPIAFNKDTKPFWIHVAGKVTYKDSWELYVWPFSEGKEANKVRFTFIDEKKQRLRFLDVEKVAYNNTWIAVVVSISKSSFKIVANGKLANGLGPFSIKESTEPVCLGGKGAFQPFQGLIAYLLLFNKSLPEDLLVNLGSQSFVRYLDIKPSIFLEPSLCAERGNVEIECLDIINNKIIEMDKLCEVNISETYYPFLWIIRKHNVTQTDMRNDVTIELYGFSKIVFNDREVNTTRLILPKDSRITLVWNRESNMIYIYPETSDHDLIVRVNVDSYFYSSIPMLVAFIIMMGARLKTKR